MSSDIQSLAVDFQKASAALARDLYDCFKDAGEEFAEDWRSNARATSGTHGRHYPNAITSETLVALGIVVETGPESGRRQGGMGMGFEFGGPKQPPHLDGAKALPRAEARIQRAADIAIGHLLP